MKIFLVTALILFSTLAIAHEGDHGPAQKVAPHGGVLRDSESLMYELVRGSRDIKIYLLTHDGTSIDAKAVEIDSTKTSLTDAKKKKVSYSLVPDKNYFILKFEKGSSYRYLLNLVASFEGKENKASWQIEMDVE
ncbi:MAG: hypothetical protein A2Z20_11310 [Bdellovibrionales bacterium RBG_16_40_8]|nr:MAG: hypothetical protein A2Z20_11310 [Bdellovibrionales bacterium RBG_16_40_8]